MSNFHYKVMLLRNARATYQRVIFQDMLHVYLEDYVNDVIVKSQEVT